MGLSSVLSTAITGLQASETTLDVAGNNVANSNTVGFKASEAVFATQFLQTLGLGSAPTTSSGGTNPRQVGLGVQVVGINPNFQQGTLAISSNPSDLAIQGDGFFIVQSQSGEQLYTRNGKFQTNSQDELVTTTGDRLLGFGIDDKFSVQKTSLKPLSIPLGSAAVAKATDNVFLEGTLTPTGDIADTARIIQSGVLGDALQTAPDTTGTTLTAPAAVPAATTSLAAAAGGSLAVGAYQYKITFGDPNASIPRNDESLASAATAVVTLGAGQTRVDLSNIPTAPAGSFTERRIYRSTDGGATYQFLKTIADNTTTTAFDDGGVAAGANLDSTQLSGNYSYYVVFADTVTVPGGSPSGNESRPSPLLGPKNVINGRLELTGIPTDASGQWKERRIYRNLSSDDSKFYYVGSIPNMTAGQSFTDHATDASISTGPNAKLIDLDGPRIKSNTLLKDVLIRNDNQFQKLFNLTLDNTGAVTGVNTLAFTSRKGDRQLGTKEFTITNTTTILDLTNFMQDAMGIQETPGIDPSNPVPGDSSGVNPGGSTTSNGEIRFVGNNGLDNAIEIGLSGLQLTTSAGTSQVNLSFGTKQEAKGQSAVADFIAFDSLGIPVNVRVTSVLERRTGTETVYRWFANSSDNDPLSGAAITVGTGLVSFDGQGKLITTTNSTVSIDRSHVPSAKPMEFKLDFSQISGLAAPKSALAATRQDGFPPGKLTSYIVGEDGVIRGVFDNGTQRDLGQIRLARFANANGLEQRGQNLYATGVNSGLPVQGNPNEQGIGSIIAGAVEQSNTDVGKNLIDLILASTEYRGNSRVITTAQQLLDELLNLRR